MITLLHNMFVNIAPCVTGQLRLEGGNIENEGRVEICMHNVWGTVCLESWGSADATVVCRQLGYSTQGWSEHLPCTCDYLPGTLHAHATRRIVS